MDPNKGSVIVVPIIKRIEIIMSIQLCLNSWINFNYEENDGKKAFLANPNINIRYPNEENVILMPIRKRMEFL